MSVAPPHNDRIGVESESRISLFRRYNSSMRESNRAGGSVCGVDIVMITEIRVDGRREVATMPPME